MTEAQLLALEVVESVYTDGVDAIGEPTTYDAGNIVVKFQDGNKVLTATIYPNRDSNDIEIKMDNPEVAA
jgi:sucrose-6-phosphate hydrolase SacC (GH32 family)